MRRSCWPTARVASDGAPSVNFSDFILACVAVYALFVIADGLQDIARALETIAKQGEDE